MSLILEFLNKGNTTSKVDLWKILHSGTKDVSLLKNEDFVKRYLKLLENSDVAHDVAISVDTLPILIKSGHDIAKIEDKILALPKAEQDEIIDALIATGKTYNVAGLKYLIEGRHFEWGIVTRIKETVRQ